MTVNITRSRAVNYFDDQVDGSKALFQDLTSELNRTGTLLCILRRSILILDCTVQ